MQNSTTQEQIRSLSLSVFLIFPITINTLVFLTVTEFSYDSYSSSYHDSRALSKEFLWNCVWNNYTAISHWTGKVDHHSLFSQLLTSQAFDLQIAGLMCKDIRGTRTTLNRNNSKLYSAWFYTTEMWRNSHFFFFWSMHFQMSCWIFRIKYLTFNL